MRRTGGAERPRRPRPEGPELAERCKRCTEPLWAFVGLLLAALAPLAVCGLAHGLA